MDALLISTGLVALAEVGDKTMLLAVALAAAWRRPAPILLGILAATVLNHAFAATAGAVLARYMDPDHLRWGAGLAFVGFGLWALIPEQLDERTDAEEKTFAGIFMTTAAAVFVLEMGDKTQIATALLAARFDALLPVLAGSTLGMMLVNGPAVLLGVALARRLPMKTIRLAAAAGFVLTGLWVILAG